MKNMITKAVATGMIATVAGVALAEGEASTSEVAATEVSVTADFASAYVFRGTTFNDGFVIQPGIEVAGFGIPEQYGSLAIGTWGNFDVNGYMGGTSSEFSEVDWYASYGLPSIVDGLDLSLGWTEYTYPLGGVSDKEVNLSAGHEVAGVALGVSANFMVGGEFKGQIYYDASASYAVEVTEELEVSAGALIAYIVQGDRVLGFGAGGSDDGMNDGVFDIAATYAVCENWSVGFSLAYVAQLDDEVLVDSPAGGYDVDVVGMLSLAGSF